MAEEQDNSQKTEEPSQRKLDEARKKGQVASSQEVKHLFALLGSALVVGVFGPAAADQIGVRLAGFLSNLEQIPADTEALKGLAADAALGITLVLLVPLLVLVVAALAGSMIQTGPMASMENITPKFQKISPLAGLKRQFSTRALVEFGKGLLKLVIVGTVATIVILPEFAAIDQFTGLAAAAMLHETWVLALKLVGAILAVTAAIAALDYLYQRFEFLKRQRMTKQEVKDEYKQTEGDPTVKARLRQIRLERARRRMMQAVPQADVVITNPVHFAVAMKYDPATMAAPKVLAKGADDLALKIREVARAHNVAVVENPPLARALFAAVDIDEEIPPEHYKAVAEVISYVFQLEGRRLPDR